MLQLYCLSGEGKGRIESKEGKYVFGYESQLKREVTMWSMALRAPLFGEELFHINYGSAWEDRDIASGVFWHRMKGNLKGSSQMEMIQQFSKSLGKILQLVNDVPKLNERLRCEREDPRSKKFTDCSYRNGDHLFHFQYIFTQEHLKLRFVTANKRLVELDGFGSNGKFFRRAKISLYRAGEDLSAPLVKALYRLELFTKSCLSDP